VELFEKGQRVPPPSLPGQIAVSTVAIKIVQSSGQLEIELADVTDHPLIRHRFYGGMRVLFTDAGIRINNTFYPAQTGTDAVFTERHLTPIFSRIENGRLQLESPAKELIGLPVLNAQEQMVIENTLYVRNEGSLTEMAFEHVGNRVAPFIKHVWEIMPHASSVFPGVIFQNVLGKPYLIIPVPCKDGDSAFHIRAVKELEGYRIIDGRQDAGVCMIIGHKNNQYDRLIFRFDERYEQYDCRILPDADLGPIHFVTLGKGIVISVNDDGFLEVFSKKPFDSRINRIPGNGVDAIGGLGKEGNTLLFFKGNRLYRLRMK
jgi:hypothetical protein